MDKERENDNGFIRRALKDADNKERKTNEHIKTAFQEVDLLKQKYSKGTADEYNKLASNFNSLLKAYHQQGDQYKTIKLENEQIEAAIPEKVKKAVVETSDALKQEIKQLNNLINCYKAEIEQLKQKAVFLQDKVKYLCEAIFEVMRAIFTLKYNNKDKSPNPYRSDLTEKADLLIDVLEHKSRVALAYAENHELEKGLDGMGVSAELENDVRNRIRQLRQKKAYEIGD